jgi:hypothetical protein
MTPRRTLAGVGPVDAVITLVVALALVAGGAIFLRALDYELDRQPTPPTVTPQEETSQP